MDFDRTENNRKWQVSRRKFMAIAGGAGAFAGLSMTLPGILRNGETAAAAANDESAEGSERVRRWMMIIDQRYCDGCQSQGTPPQCTQACNDGHFIPEPM